MRKNKKFSLNIDIDSDLTLFIEGEVIPRYPAIYERGQPITPEEPASLEYHSITIIKGDLVSLLYISENKSSIYSYIDDLVWEKLAELEEIENHKEFEHE